MVFVVCDCCRSREQSQNERKREETRSRLARMENRSKWIAICIIADLFASWFRAFQSQSQNGVFVVLVYGIVYNKALLIFGAIVLGICTVKATKANGTISFLENLYNVYVKIKHNISSRFFFRKGENSLKSLFQKSNLQINFLDNKFFFVWSRV